jgi:class 3 adenylate cyclase
MVPGALLYLVFTTFFGFFFVVADEVKSELRQSKSIVIDLAERHRMSLRIDGEEANGPKFAMSAAERLASGLIEGGAFFLGLCAAWAYHAPLIQFFRARRRDRPCPEDMVTAARTRIWRSPTVTALAMAVPFALVGAFRAAFSKVPLEASMLPIEVAFLALSTLFTYLWQRHLVQDRFISLLFTREELASNLPGGHRMKVRENLTLVVTLATLLPVVVVALFIGTGISFIGTFSSLSADQKTLLFGEGGAPLPSIDVEGLTQLHAGGLRLDDMPVPLIAPLDTMRIAIGLTLGLAIVLVYVFLIAHWTGLDIVKPLEALRANIDRAREGDLSALTPATTANEVGDLTVGVNAMLKGIAERGRIKELFGQYLTKEISEAILEGRVKLSGARYEATVMFTDIRGFTAMSERLSPEEVFAFLNDYLSRMIDVIAARGGIIDKFLGDGILAVFGLPVATDSHAADALGAALDMRRALGEMNAERAASGREAVRIGIGMHTGEVIAGNVGSAKKLQFTVIGDTVNLASRIEGLNKDFGSYLLVSGETYARLGDALRSERFERIEGAAVRGKSQRVDLYKLMERG